MIDDFSKKNISIVEFEPTDLLKLNYVKNYLRIDHDLDDEFLKNAINVACEYAEKSTDKIFGKKTLKLSFFSQKNIDKVEEKNGFKNIKKIVINNEEIADNNFYLNNGILFFKNSFSGDISITFEAGIEADEVNANIKQAMLYHIATIYQNKDGNFSVPQASQEIYAKYRRIKL